MLQDIVSSGDTSRQIVAPDSGDSSDSSDNNNRLVGIIVVSFLDSLIR